MNVNGGHLQTVELDDLGALRVAGADATRFLQGQLSSDLGRVSAQRSSLAGLHNPQGRAIALLRIVHLAPNDLLALLPRELAAAVASRLSKYVLRAKVKVTDESQNWRVTGLIASGLAAATGPHLSETVPAPLTDYPATAGEQRLLGDGVAICVGEQPARWLLIAPAPRGGPSEVGVPAAARRGAWRSRSAINAATSAAVRVNSAGGRDRTSDSSRRSSH